MSGKRLGVLRVHKLAFNDEKVKEVLDGNILFEFSDKEHGTFVVVENDSFALLCEESSCVPFYYVVFYPFGVYSVWDNPPFKLFIEGDNFKYYKAK